MSMNKMREIKQSTGKMKRGKRKKMGIYKAPIMEFANSSYAAQCYRDLWTEIKEAKDEKSNNIHQMIM